MRSQKKRAKSTPDKKEIIRPEEVQQTRITERKNPKTKSPEVQRNKLRDSNDQDVRIGQGEEEKGQNPCKLGRQSCLKGTIGRKRKKQCRRSGFFSSPDPDPENMNLKT